MSQITRRSSSPGMPARLAFTDPNEQVKEAIGSGPYKFVKDEWQPGNKVVYVRNGYVPRREKQSGPAGGKLVHADRRPRGGSDSKDLCQTVRVESSEPSGGGRPGGSLSGSPSRSARSIGTGST